MSLSRVKKIFTPAKMHSLVILETAAILFGVRSLISSLFLPGLWVHGFLMVFYVQ